MELTLQILSIVLVLATFILSIWRILARSGINLKKRIDLEPERESYIPDKKECVKVFVYSLAFRIAVIILGLVIYWIFIANAKQVSFTDMINSWRAWDARHYMSISESYTAFVEDGNYVTLAFFPLYPWLIKIVHIIIPYTELAGIVTSSLCTSLACVFLYKLVALDYGKNIAEKSVKLMNIVPLGFFFGAIMSEGTFLLTSIMTLYYIRKHNWVMVGISGMLASLTRSVRSVFSIPSNNRIYRRI